MILSDLNSYTALFKIKLESLPCVFKMLADRQGVPIALTKFCSCSNLLLILVVYK